MRRPRGADARTGPRLLLIAPPVRTAGAGLLGNALPAARTILGLPLAAAVTVATDIASRSPLALYAPLASSW